MIPSIPRFLPHVLLATACFLGLAAASVWASEVTIGTGAAAAENIFKKIEFSLNRTLNIKLNIIDSGPVQALKDLDADKLHCAVGGVAFADWMEMMKKDGYVVADPSVYRSWVIGQDRIKVLTNLDVPVKSLSKEQLVAIFSGAITNWSQVGGPDKPIVVVVGSRIPGTMSVFQKQIMGNAAFTKEAMVGTTAEDIKSRVIRNAGAIGLGTISQVDYLVNGPEIPEIARPITLITKGAPTEDVEKMINYINTAGQRFIVK
ncbi:MAG: substrate-binding domain-containing protein [Desulfobulbus sp.]|jgi:phosphate transport system substrate-binding protein|uniref:substrate-binding domain-containing protein n=1 Tax=Desulfobulbus sp. TaxID=895 RepID=UPI002847C15C|nr:substrate-binding domain-containing protein [Desulfobulbus sp.]MDR2549189.1 substrate-binding domain-containing protein [Desulfobulbus sp.]